MTNEDLELFEQRARDCIASPGPSKRRGVLAGHSVMVHADDLLELTAAYRERDALQAVVEQVRAAVEDLFTQDATRRRREDPSSAQDELEDALYNIAEITAKTKVAL